MSDQNAVATRPNSPLVPSKSEVALSSPLDIQHVAGRGEVQRVELTVTVPANFQYVIPGRRNDKYQDERGKWVDNWVDDNKVGLTSDGYDFLNRGIGVAFWLPDWVNDRDGQMVRNPIHQPDYIYIRMGAVWYNAVGQLVSHIEDLEVNYVMVWHQARLESPGAEMLLDNDGQPMFDERGLPAIRINDHTGKPFDGKPGKVTTSEEQERKALKALMNLRSMGMRYAQTVLRTRLLKVATGIKSLPLQQPRPFPINIVGYRDRMDPQERRAKAEAGLTALYGGAKPDAKPLSREEMSEIEVAGDVEESIDRTVVHDDGNTPMPVAPPEDDEFVVAG